MLGRLRQLTRRVLSPANNSETSQILFGQVLNHQIAMRGDLPIRDAEFKVFSQWGEDGIIQYLIRRIGIPPERQTFIEFGVENYQESNTRFLLLNNNWRGLVMDGSADHMVSVKARGYYWRHDLTAIAAFVNRDNINELISNAGFSGQIGLLSIDIDGNDYWVWEQLNVVDPIIVIVEYRSLWGASRSVTIPYDKNFSRNAAHYSNLYYGASLKALHDLGKSKGFSLVHCNTAGNNAFFVKTSALNGLNALTPQEAFVHSRYRESRAKDGSLSFLSTEHQLIETAELPLVDLDAGKAIKVGDLR